MNKVAICVGHSRRINGRLEGGAVSVSGVQEWHYNQPVAEHLKDFLASHGIDSVVFNNYEGGSYTAAMAWLSAQIKRQKCTLALELHFNSGTESAKGHEWLYWHTSELGRRLAMSVEASMKSAYPLAHRRGVKERKKPQTAQERAENRGWQFLLMTHCPSIICEPFFGSNPAEWERMKNAHGILASAIGRGIVAHAKQPGWVGWD